MTINPGGRAAAIKVPELLRDMAARRRRSNIATLMTRPKKVAFLFGAGASAYSDAGGCPPLGKDLFARMRDANLIPTILPPDVIRIFETDDNFEHGMEALAATDQNELYIPFVRAMALYFSRFVPGPANLYRELFERLRGSSVAFDVASLNYDSLVDICKREAGFHKPVCKPHGSCGFLPDMRRNAFIQPKSRGVTKSAVGALITGCNVERVTDADVIRKWLARPGDEWLGPVMSFYAPTKQSIICPEVIEQERAIWRDMVAWAEACFVIGVACIPDDKHVWGPLAASVSEVIFVNPSDAGFAHWQQLTGRSDAHRWPVGFGEAIPRMFGHTPRAQRGRRRRGARHC